jgi:hypothetical protein
MSYRLLEDFPYLICWMQRLMRRMVGRMVGIVIPTRFIIILSAQMAKPEARVTRSKHPHL